MFAGLFRIGLNYLIARLDNREADEGRDEAERVGGVVEKSLERARKNGTLNTFWVQKASDESVRKRERVRSNKV